MIILSSVTYWGLADLLEARVITSSRPLDPRQEGPFRRISRRIVFLGRARARMTTPVRKMGFPCQVEKLISLSWGSKGAVEGRSL